MKIFAMGKFCVSLDIKLGILKRILSKVTLKIPFIMGIKMFSQKEVMQPNFCFHLIYFLI